jgi:hypothetical protein
LAQLLAVFGLLLLLGASLKRQKRQRRRAIAIAGSMLTVIAVVISPAGALEPVVLGAFVEGSLCCGTWATYHQVDPEHHPFPLYSFLGWAWLTAVSVALLFVAGDYRACAIWVVCLPAGVIVLCMAYLLMISHHTERLVIGRRVVEEQERRVRLAQTVMEAYTAADDVDAVVRGFEAEGALRYADDHEPVSALLLRQAVAGTPFWERLLPGWRSRALR